MSDLGVRVMNVTQFKIPTEDKLTTGEKGELSALQARKHLTAVKNVLDRDGKVVQVIEPLTDAERAIVEDRSLQLRLASVPRCGDVHYEFAPYGEDGCVWIMPSGHANLLVQRWNGILRVLPWREALPKGVKERFPSRVPTPNQISYGTENPTAGPVYQSPDAEDMVRASLNRDGDFVDTGDMFPRQAPQERVI